MFEKLLRLTSSARDDYSRLTSSVLVSTSSQSSIEPVLSLRPADDNVISSDCQRQRTSSAGHKSRQRNGFFVHTPPKNCSVRPTNGLREEIAVEISSRTQSASSDQTSPA